MISDAILQGTVSSGLCGSVEIAAAVFAGLALDRSIRADDILILRAGAVQAELIFLCRS